MASMQNQRLLRVLAVAGLFAMAIAPALGQSAQQKPATRAENAVGTPDIRGDYTNKDEANTPPSAGAARRTGSRRVHRSGPDAARQGSRAAAAQFGRHQRCGDRRGADALKPDLQARGSRPWF
jgi:hypothetical protein